MAKIENVGRPFSDVMMSRTRVSSSGPPATRRIGSRLPCTGRPLGSKTEIRLSGIAVSMPTALTPVFSA